MKTGIKNRFLLPALIAGLGLVQADPLTAQTFTVLKNFTLNECGERTPSPALVLFANRLYGTSDTWRDCGGALFTMNTDGSGYTVLTNLIVNEQWRLGVLSGSIIYGTRGLAIFKVNTNGTDFTVLKTLSPLGYDPNTETFTNSDGANLTAGLVLSGTALYGTASSGGSSGYGTVFKVNTNGTDFTVLKTFTGTNGDGGYPYGGLVQGTNGTLYGTTRNAEKPWPYRSIVGNSGTIFEVNPDGTGYTVLKSFSVGGYNPSTGTFTNVDGANPSGALVLSGSTLYGTTDNGSSSGYGAVFKINTNGTDYTVLRSFMGTGGDGAYPVGGLAEGNDGALYGTTTKGGIATTNIPCCGCLAPYFNGTVFKLNKDGTRYTVVQRFTGEDGAYPLGLVAGGDDRFYGTTDCGGSVGNGTVFALAVKAVRQLPSGYWPNVKFVVSVRVTPTPGSIVNALEEFLSAYPDNTQTTSINPTLIVGAISDGGTYDPVHFKIKFGPFFDDLPRTLTYELTPPPGTTNYAVFGGTFSVDGVNYTVVGDTDLNLYPLHPADNSPPIDKIININEVTAYAAAWKIGNTWPVEPNAIPIAYMTRAGALWKGGEHYIFNGQLTNAPLCWVNTNPPALPLAPPPPQALSALGVVPPPPDQSTNSVVCSMTNRYAPNVPVLVTLAITPATNVAVYAVEDQVPIGWVVSGLSNGGLFDPYNLKVKWGPFFDSVSRTLTYQVTPVSNATGIVNFVGIGSFDGVGLSITGARQISDGAIPLLTLTAPVFVPQEGFRFSLISSLAGTSVFQISTDLTNWISLKTNVVGVGATGFLDPTATNSSRRFYRTKYITP